MKHLGHISITDKVVFVYYELEKPDQRNFVVNSIVFDEPRWEKYIEQYNASKREVEVENARKGIFYDNGKLNRYIQYPNGDLLVIKHLEPCEAEVNGKATIVKIN